MLESRFYTSINQTAKLSGPNKPQIVSRDIGNRLSKSVNATPLASHKRNGGAKQDGAILCTITSFAGDRNTLSKFIQAGVGYAFMRDNETNTIQPIFPSTTPMGVKKCGMNTPVHHSCTLSGQAYGDEVKGDDAGGRTRHSQVADESNSKARLRSCGRANHAVTNVDEESKYQEMTYPRGDVLSKPPKGQSDAMKVQRATNPCCSRSWLNFTQGGVKKQITSSFCQGPTSPSIRRKFSDSKNDIRANRTNKRPIYSSSSPRVVSRFNGITRKASKSPKRSKDRPPSIRSKVILQEQLQQPSKFRFFLKETDEINNMLNDPDDRRIRTICERFQCDLDIYAKNLIGGFMQYTVDIAAPNASCLLGCVKNLDSALGWHIAPQLGTGSIQK